MKQIDVIDDNADMKRLFLITILGFIFFLSAKGETTYYKVVAADGSGDYALIQDAIDAVLVYQEQNVSLKIIKCMMDS